MGVDFSTTDIGNTVPVTVASLPLPTGAATSALQTQPGVDIGDVTVNNAAGASAVNIQDGGNSLTVDGSVAVTGNVEVTNDVGNPIPVNGTVAATQSGIFTARLQDGSGQAVTSTSINGRQALDTRRADVSLTAVTAVGVSGAAVTCTLPAVASVFHYIQGFRITKYAVAALTGVATPITVTSTNLPGNLAWTFPTAQAIGTVVEYNAIAVDAFRSSVSNTATTIVCPATTNVIWRISVVYYTTG